MNKLFLYYILSLATALCTASGQTIEGIVVDKATGYPLAGANVAIKNTYLGSCTNFEGQFQIDVSDLKASAYVLQITYIGYHNLENAIKIPLKNNEVQIFQLKESFLQLDQIVVTGTRTERFLKNTPVTTQVINSAQLKSSGGSDISDVLQEITGITIHANQFGTGVNTVELQGFGSEHILLLIDGVKVIGRVNGQLDIAQIPISQVERVEIVKGATSSLYGSEAMGGVINIITKQTSDNVDINAWGKTGSYGRLEGGVKLNLPFSTWQSALNLSIRRYEGFDLDEQTEKEDATAYRKYHGQFNLHKQLSKDFNLEFRQIYFSEDHNVVSSAVFQDRIQNEYLAFRALINKKALFSMMNLKGSVEFSQHDHHFDRIVVNSGFLKKGSLTTERLGKIDIVYDFKIGKHIVNGGYAFENESIKSDRVIGGYRNSNLHDLFIQNEVKPYLWLTVVGGARIDIHSVYGSQVSPKLSLMLSPQHNKRIRFSYGKGFRAPSFKELFIDYTNISVNYHIEGNPNLQTESSDAFQLDFEFWNSANYHNRIHFFSNQIYNLIDYKYMGIIDGFGTYRTANLSSVNTWGGEWDMEYFPSNWIKLTLGYSYMDSKNNLTGNPMSFKSKHRGHSAIQFYFTNDINFNIRSQYVGKRFYWDNWDEETNAGTKEWIDAYLLFHAHISIILFDHFNVSLGGRNLTNYVDKIWGPMPGREFYAGVSYTLK